MPKHVCSKCDVNLEPLTPVVQYYRGRWEGAITPKPHELFAEWHERPCFAGEFDLQPQRKPYRCGTCGVEIRFGDQISFFVRGEETSRHYTAAESGDVLYNVNHYPKCSDAA